MNIMTYTPEEIDRLARKRAGAKMGWYIHAAVYLLVNAALFAASEYGLGNHHWRLGPLLGWGLGVMFHGISVFWLGKGSSLRERMVQKERERLQQQHPQG